jgi:hypothetical protein
MRTFTLRGSAKPCVRLFVSTMLPLSSLPVKVKISILRNCSVAIRTHLYTRLQSSRRSHRYIWSPTTTLLSIS